MNLLKIHQMNELINSLNEFIKNLSNEWMNSFINYIC